MRAMPTRRYSEIKGLRRRGLMSPAAGPCEIPGCRMELSPGRYRIGYVYDHCHRHDYIRGVICLYHNAAPMQMVDAHVLAIDRGWDRDRDACIAHWARCPSCAAGGPWEPWQTYPEHWRGQQLQIIVSLADELAGRIPPRPVSPNVVPLSRQLRLMDPWLRHHARTDRWVALALADA